MSEQQYTLARITEITERLDAEITLLMETLQDEEMYIPAFIDIFRKYAHAVALWGAFDKDGRCAGIVYGKAPTKVYPNRGELPITAVLPEVPQRVTKAMFDLVHEWCRQHGAKYMWGWTRRSPRVIKRLYGYEICKEKQLICPLSGCDEHLRVEREVSYGQ